MRDALKRLRATQQQLESTHRLTSELLRETERLIEAIEQGGPVREPAGRADTVTRRTHARRSTPRARRLKR